uniref:Receptor kinase-like protein Xa21 n=1 Tax=Oryza barthii TaxID=65489 RepID=A0A0D3FM82_9ORYZ
MPGHQVAPLVNIVCRNVYALRFAGNEGVMSVNQPVNLTMLVPWALLLLSYGVGSVRCATVPGNNTDVLSLLEFKATTNDPRGALSSWNTSIHYCGWSGVTCNPKNRGRVTTLNLANQGLSGQIAFSIGNLTVLHTLNLSNNQFVGQIPPLNNLQKLQFLDLSRNSLDGVIPDSLTNCSNLRELNLHTNFIAGTIPPKIGSLSKLVQLAVFSNNLTGTIPTTIRNCTRLERLDLGSNQLEGIIPDELGHLSNISMLFLGGNWLSGGIPASLFQLSALRILDLDTNMLNKTLPPNMGDLLPNLQKLNLAGNMFEGQIPDSLGNASGLDWIGLSENKFSGKVPSSFGKLSKLYSLNLGHNMLEARDSQSWAFLNALTNCSLLQVLSLVQNNLEGVIPNSVGNLSPRLQTLAMGWNYLSGEVPPSISNLNGLTTLGLRSNNLSGKIGEWIGNIENLQVLHLQENNFVGPIPSSIGDLTELLSLVLAKNKFEGPIPPKLGNLRQIAQLNLSYNKLEGSIPQDILTLPRLRKCALSYNNLNGTIPADLSKLQQLTDLYLSSNALNGDIPDSLGQCGSLQTIQMDQNFLTGNIPVSFANLTSISNLNLSHNNLSGTIPVTLSGLRYLTQLDISYNHLNGKVPGNGVFENATAVSLQGNWGLCGGATELHLPSCQSISNRAERQYYLMKILIPLFGFMSLILLVYILFVVKKASTGKYMQQSPFGKQFPKVTYKDLAQATRNFSESNLVGRGSYGSVYRGKLKEPDMEVAVKVFDLETRGAERSFMSECEALRSIQHRNLLPIITACSTVDTTGNVFKALVYAFMSNGNLDSWLHKKGDGKASKRLGLIQRISIAVNIADALDYLHNDCGRPIVHCDIKPSNILLDDDMNALLGDFGIATFYVESQSASTGTISSLGVKGTIGYIGPEYAGGGRHVSTTGDVYSYGIVLLEMMTGKRPTDPIFKDGLDIVNFVASNFPHQIFQVIDAHLMEEYHEFVQANMVSENAFHQCLASLLQVALSCAQPLPGERMNMKEVATKMNEIKTSHLGWKLKRHASPERTKPE